MKKESGASKSVWIDGITMPATHPLQENITCDVCIVGAGIAGLTTAYLLAKEGKNVVVLEAKDTICGGETSRTTAHLASALDDGFPELIRLFGVDGTRLAVQSHKAAIDKIEAIIKDEKIDCDFKRLDGYMFANDQKDEEQLLKELEALQQIGWRDVVLRKTCPVDTLTALPCLHFPNQGRFHVLKYLSSLSNVLLDKDVRIYTSSKALEFRTGAIATVVTENGNSVSANQLVVTTNTPVNDMVTMHTKQAPYRTYVVGARIPRGAVPDALYWDMKDPYHYVRIQEADKDAGEGADDLLIVGGEDHKTGQDDHPALRLQNLEHWMRMKFPMAGEVVYRWSGQVMEPVDSLAFIGRNPGDVENVYIATGDSGHGMTHGTIAGILLTDLIMGRRNDWEKLYDPARVSLKTSGEFLKENMNVAAQYKDYLTGGEVSDPSEVMPGTGKIMRKGTTKVAVYCDQDGVRHECSAICTHLGCVVSWNNVESSWDCPCHGSRFDPFGKVITGPATRDLEAPK
ncbi:FAD-dependent oxidoreductase [Pontibacter sp. BT310]|uniref:FAD-dependent oxidoreductase n=1 Tax=Pontibacter populi TaxID=890055 RepID=A0ABS6XA83_9BACT|nr:MULTISPECIES: FAD-dependent oxidoreductase [Pontibacter]MBJ6118051.1 FAD-dependent oxidoreductase [Pontibacter sp. BT310]MBR0570478.1 FAD-dependent oxidoreductase [Microvirga sp. STS03]MBW3364904.1 FAD-dependent oxidoreductase [Pontibacter populi]